jgi:hypothetical protein
MTFTTLAQKFAIATGAIAAASFVAAAPANAALLGRYTFGTATSGPALLTPSDVDSSISLSSLAYNGSVTTATGRTSTLDSGTGEYKDVSGVPLGSNGTGGAAGGTISSTANTFEFTVTPNSGDVVVLDKLQLDWRRSNTAGNSLNIFSNRDNFSSALATFTNNTGDSWLIDRDVLLSALPGNLTSPAVFRLVASGSAGTFRLDNVEVYGTATAVPTPALLPALLGFGARIVRKRKQETV